VGAIDSIQGGVFLICGRRSVLLSPIVFSVDCQPEACYQEKVLMNEVDESTGKGHADDVKKNAAGIDGY
jgi:hypothetical protein